MNQRWDRREADGRRIWERALLDAVVSPVAPTWFKRLSVALLLDIQEEEDGREGHDGEEEHDGLPGSRRMLSD